MTKLILRSELCPGDIVMLTAAVRDLHRTHPGMFKTDVRTPCPALWAHNPYITPIRENEHGVRVIDCEYPLIHQSNTLPYHFVHGYTRHLAECLGVRIEPTAFKGDIHISEEEKRWEPQVFQHLGRLMPYWIIVAGGKRDFTIKWWDHARWQEVVDLLRGRVLFVQTGGADDEHPPLKGVLDLRGKTTLRELVRLVYHAQGVLCPVTSLMHLAAAVETPQPGLSRPCVVVAGGREPSHWEAYPGHRFIHTIGALSCCATSGCWRARTLPLHDGDPKDHPSQRCMQVTGHLPQCMDMITPEAVVAQIESYFQPGGPWRLLDEGESRHAARVLGWDLRDLRFRMARTEEGDRRWGLSSNGETPLSPGNVKTRLALALARLPPVPPERFEGRGVVICGGGLRYLPSAWVNVRMLRQHGCRLPVELWHFPGEMDESMCRLLEAEGVTCVECQKRAAALGLQPPLSGWEMKPLAILGSAFREVLFLDADNMTVADPEYLFESAPYRETGAVFWPDYTSLAADDPVWELCGVPYRDEPEFESGQILIDKVRHWRPLQLALWFNRHAAFFRHYFLGDKETFHFAFRILEVPWSRPPWAIKNLDNVTMCQHDFAGRRIFQHRNLAKWSLHGPNPSVAGFLFEAECVAQLRELRRRWDGLAPKTPRWPLNPKPTRLMNAHAGRLTGGCWHLTLDEGPSCRAVLRADGRVLTVPSSKKFLYWDLKPAVNRPRLLLSSEAGAEAELEFDGSSEWGGQLAAKEPVQPIRLSRTPWFAAPDPRMAAFRPLTRHPWALRIQGMQQRTLVLEPSGLITEGAGMLEQRWSLHQEPAGLALCFHQGQETTARLTWKAAASCWEGCWNSPTSPRLSLHPLRPRPVPDEATVPFAGHGLAFPCQADVLSPWYGHWCRLLDERPRLHRQQWELVCLLQLADLAARHDDVRKVLMVNPPEGPFIDVLAGIGVSVTAVFFEDWSWLPPTKQRGQFASIKRELNRKGVTPWEVFADRVTVESRPRGQVPSLFPSWIGDPQHTAILWHDALEPDKDGTSPAVAFGDLLAMLPRVRLTALAFDTLIAAAKDKPPSPQDDADAPLPPCLVHQQLCRHAALPLEAFAIRPAAMDLANPADAFVDPVKFDNSHHLKCHSDDGVVTSLVVHWTQSCPASDGAQ